MTLRIPSLLCLFGQNVDNTATIATNGNDSDNAPILSPLLESNYHFSQRRWPKSPEANEGRHLPRDLQRRSSAASSVCWHWLQKIQPSEIATAITQLHRCIFSGFSQTNTV
jgi:hypothetical protein